jgi:hypothetical protein
VKVDQPIQIEEEEDDEIKQTSLEDVVSDSDVSDQEDAN